MLLDEPTAALGVQQTEQVLSLVKRLRERDLGVVVISHNLADVFEVADRIVVLRLGRRAADFDVKDASREQVVAAITGADTKNGSPPKRRPRPAEGGLGEMEAAAKVKELGDAERQPGLLGQVARGELGSLRVLIVLAVIWTIFQVANDRFLTSINLTNLSLQIAAVGTISVGVVLVLLLGEIDLSVGAVSGLAAAVMAVLTVKSGWDRRRWRCSPGCCVGTAIGLFNGFMVTFVGIPSFVVTLAGLLAWQGALLSRARGHRDRQPARQRHHRPDRHLLRADRRLDRRGGGDRRACSAPGCSNGAGASEAGLEVKPLAGLADPHRAGRRRLLRRRSRSGATTAASRWRR